MKIFPAIDLRGGKVVRLTEGDYDRMKTYGDSPVETAKMFESMGAKHLHVVDLKTTKNGGSANTEIFCKIAKETNLFIQTGGGIRTEEKIQQMVDESIETPQEAGGEGTTELAQLFPAALLDNILEKNGVYDYIVWEIEGN